MRRDELWLMQLDRRNASCLRPLRAYSPRRYEKVAHSYLKGRYGAVPQVDIPSLS
jgi:hypothetical protein